MITFNDLVDPRPRGLNLISERAARALGYLAFLVTPHAPAEMRSRAKAVLDDDYGLQTRAMAETTLEAGGALVPDEVSSEIIRLTDNYGAIRANSRVMGMKAVMTWVKRTGGLTVYRVTDGQTITASDLGLGAVSLTAKKLATLTVASNELEEDAIVDLGRLIAEEAAAAFAESEDRQGFLGDGTSTYFHTLGIIKAIEGVDATIANIASIVVASGAAWTDITKADLMAVMGRCTAEAHRNAKWYCHRQFYYNVMVDLMADAGGAAAHQAMGGGRGYFSYPVVFVECLPKATAAETTCCVFGDLRRGCVLGDSRKRDIASAKGPYFATDQVAIRCTERLDFVCHDRGNASATASLRVPGGIILLRTDAEA